MPALKFLTSHVSWEASRIDARFIRSQCGSKSLGIVRNSHLYVSKQRGEGLTYKLRSEPVRKIGLFLILQIIIVELCRRLLLWCVPTVKAAAPLANIYRFQLHPSTPRRSPFALQRLPFRHDSVTVPI